MYREYARYTIAVRNDVGMVVMAMEYKALSVPDITKRVRAAFQRFDIQKAAVFGSSARGEMHRGSDVDILIDLGDYSSGLIFVDIKRSLEHALRRKVDLISFQSLEYTNMKDEILSEAQVIYEKRP